MNKLLGHIKKSFLNILPALIFFLLMFHMLAVSKALILKEYGIVIPSSAVAIIGSLIVAKVVLIADKLPFLNLYPKKPLIYTVAVKTFVFGIVTIIFFLLEALIHQGIKIGNFSGAWEHMNAEVDWQAFWLREAWVFVMILFYCAATELARAVGAGRVKEIFFGRTK